MSGNIHLGSFPVTSYETKRKMDSMSCGKLVTTNRLQL